MLGFVVDCVWSPQVHVLTFTVYHLLCALKPSLKGGDLDPCMNLLVEVRD